jgi:hypothetical protein
MPLSSCLLKEVSLRPLYKIFQPFFPNFSYGVENDFSQSSHFQFNRLSSIRIRFSIMLGVAGNTVYL